MRISVITISYNSGATIERTIKSVISQDYSDKEYIIVDGGSTDGTMDIVRRYASSIAAYVSEPDRGRSDAFNKGIKMATGDLIVMINSDDYLLPGALTEVARHYDGKTDIYCGNLLLWDGKSTAKRRIYPSLDFPVMPFFRRPAHQGVFATRSIYQRLGGYDVNIKYAMDLDFLMRATKAGARFKHMDVDVAVFLLGGATSESIFKKKEYRYIVRKNGGNWLQAWGFYLFLIITQTAKRLLQTIGVDLVRIIRYRTVKS